MKPIIEYKNISKSYNENTVIEKFNLHIDRGEFVTILGSSGCGKTTVLKMVNGLIEPSSGDIIINGKNIKELNLIDLRRKIGYSIQGSILFPHMTVEQNIIYVPSLSNKMNKSKNAEMVLKWMKFVGLSIEIKDRYPDELSGGQRQRVGIARALAASPEILLMDEPFGAVDEITRSSLQDEIMRIHKETGITIMFVTHDVSEAMKMGTKVLIMDFGNVRQYDTPDNIRNTPSNDFVMKLLELSK